MKNNFQVGEIFFLTHGVGELHIEAVMIKKISKGIATVVKCLHGVDFFRDEFEVSVGALIRDRDLIQEVFDYIKANQCKNITQKLFNAIKNNDIDEVKEYIERGADKNARDIRGKTPLMLACQQKKPKTKIVDSLIEAGADVDARDNDGWTALFVACEYDRPEMAELLINAGADINARDKEGKTAFDIAKENKYQKIIDLLKNYNKKTKNYGKTTIQCN